MIFKRSETIFFNNSEYFILDILPNNFSLRMIEGLKLTYHVYDTHSKQQFLKSEEDLKDYKVREEE